MALYPVTHAIDRAAERSQSWTMAQPTATPDDSDAQLVAAAQRGDHAAFTALHDRYARVVHGVVLSRVPPGEVDDLVQDVFVRAWEKVANVRDINAFPGWLAQVARNRASDFHRARRDTVRMEGYEPADPRSGHDSEAVRVLSLLRTLPEAYRETLTLRLVEGLTGPEIAEQTGLTPGSVRVNLHRGMKLLKDKLGWNR